MAKLLLCLEGMVLREFSLDRESFTIGRKAQSDIQIDDITISSKHAVIKVEKNAYMDNIKDVYVEDLGSTNGTLVNGQRIKKHMLRHGDVILLGRHEFKFLDEDAPDFDKTMMVNPDAEKLKTRALLPAAVKLLTGPKAGHTLDIVKSYTTMGNAGNSVIISKRSNGYFVAHVRPKGAVIVDMPPTLNDRPIGAQSIPLNDHDVIEIAGMKLEFFLKT
jgi:pSer/pThr/pTyr-binding forkhead associated (FHA) protein